VQIARAIVFYHLRQSIFDFRFSIFDFRLKNRISAVKKLKFAAGRGTIDK
jgi:hypothetical protein